MRARPRAARSSATAAAASSAIRVPWPSGSSCASSSRASRETASTTAERRPGERGHRRGSAARGASSQISFGSPRAGRPASRSRSAGCRRRRSRRRRSCPGKCSTIAATRTGTRAAADLERQRAADAAREHAEPGRHEHGRRARVGRLPHADASVVLLRDPEVRSIPSGPASHDAALAEPGRGCETREAKASRERPAGVGPAVDQPWRDELERDELAAAQPCRERRSKRVTRAGAAGRGRARREGPVFHCDHGTERDESRAPATNARREPRSMPWSAVAVEGGVTAAASDERDAVREAVSPAVQPRDLGCGQPEDGDPADALRAPGAGARTAGPAPLGRLPASAW